MNNSGLTHTPGPSAVLIQDPGFPLETKGISILFRVKKGVLRDLLNRIKIVKLLPLHKYKYSGLLVYIRGNVK